MDNAHLIGLSRQIGLRRQMDVVANNLANMNTTGFRAEAILFEEYVGPVARDRFHPTLDQPVSFVQDWATMHDFAPGSILQTGNPLDVALQGDGFLVVDTPAGERWTRAGGLHLDAQGTLVTVNGHPVMGESGSIRFAADETDIAITADGTVTSSAGNKGRLRLVEFVEPQALAREGDNLFSGGEPVPATTTRVAQGALETSNVSGITEMAHMIRVNRAYQSLANMMHRQDELRRTAIQRLGDIAA